MNKTRWAGERSSKPSVFNLKQAHARRLAHDVQELGGIERLLEKAISTSPYCFECRALGVAACDHHDLKRRIVRSRYINERKTFHNVVNLRWKMKITDHHFDIFIVD